MFVWLKVALVNIFCFLLTKWRLKYRGPYIDAFCQVWFHLAQLFQRSKLKYEKVNGRTTDAKRWQYYPPTNMAAKSNSCFWLANVKKIFSSETAWQNGAKLGRKHLCKILYKARDTPRDHLCQVWTLHRCFLPNLARFGHAISEETIFLTLANQKKELVGTSFKFYIW
jgi:hypothetical protein